LQRPYWTRVWIQQEVMCASKVVIQFGTQEIPLDLFHQAFASAQKYTSQFMTVSEKWLSSPAILTAFGERVAKLLTRKAELEGSLSSQFMNWQLSMLESQFEMKCKDCKDKIYGLIGVMDVWQNGKLKVNYELPVEDVYTQAFKQFVGASESLDIMCSQPRFPADLRMANLPSWCPDWSQGTDPKDCRFESPEDVHKRPPQTLYRGGIEDYIAAGGSRPVVQFLDCNKILLAKGLQFDIIERTSEELFEISLQKGDSDATAWYNLEEMAVAGRGGPYWSWWAFQRFRLEWKIPDDRGKFGMAQDFIEYGCK
jgi:hypothetical protein